MKYRITVVILILTATITSEAQLISDPEIPEDLRSQSWTARWVAVPGSPAYDFGVYFFRNILTLEDLPEAYRIHVTADNRYKLYVNDSLVGLGPARSEPGNWMYDTYDISSYLSPGENIIAAEVWNFGDRRPVAQLSYRTGFIVQEDDPGSTLLNTPGTWKCIPVEQVQAVQPDRKSPGTPGMVGPGESHIGEGYPWGWKRKGFDDNPWLKPQSLYKANPKGVGTSIRYGLIPRSIPAMKYSNTTPPVIRETGSTSSSIENQPLREVIIPAQSQQTILLDQQQLITTYPELTFSGGKDASITLTYAEALYDEQGKKQHRDSVRNMHVRGLSDQIYPDGGVKRSFTPLWFRTFRYIQLEVETEEEPLTLHGITPFETGYPFTEKGYFRSSDPALENIWKTGWRTSLACANELFFDCPYYEQLQYVGDTRIQALISLYVSGDERLMKKAIHDFYLSKQPEGFTFSRYPSSPGQIIPTFSLFWISMIHDYLWNRNDYLFAAKYLVSIQHVLHWFESRIDRETGLLGPLEHWPFVDWTDEWPWDHQKSIGGMPPGAKEGYSSIITLQYAMTLNQAADIFNFYGLEALADGYAAQARSLITAVNKYCWDPERELYADTPTKKSFSQHANTFALLAGAIPKEDQALFIERVIRDESLIQASTYFRFYLYRAAAEAGLGNKYLSYLGPWKKMINHGLTTFPEIPDLENTRSDCHAWSSSPVYEMLTTVAGFKSASVGFENLIIEPHPGNLEWIEAGIPHPYGMITVDLKFSKRGTVTGTINIPPGLKGVFIWDNQTYDLKPGKQRISMMAMDSRYKLN